MSEQPSAQGHPLSTIKEGSGYYKLRDRYLIYMSVIYMKSSIFVDIRTVLVLGL